MPQNGFSTRSNDLSPHQKLFELKHADLRFFELKNAPMADKNIIRFRSIPA